MIYTYYECIMNMKYDNIVYITWHDMIYAKKAAWSAHT